MFATTGAPEPEVPASALLSVAREMRKQAMGADNNTAMLIVAFGYIRGVIELCLTVPNGA